MGGKDGTDWTEERVSKNGLDRWEGKTAQIEHMRGKDVRDCIGERERRYR
jgi:hypothetical protein